MQTQLGEFEQKYEEEPHDSAYLQPKTLRKASVLEKMMPLAERERSEDAASIFNGYKKPSMQLNRLSSSLSEHNMGESNLLHIVESEHGDVAISPLASPFRLPKASGFMNFNYPEN